MQVTSKNGRFKVTMPGVPVVQPVKFKQVKNDKIVYHLYTLTTSHSFYYAGYAEWKDGGNDLPLSTFRDVRSRFLKVRKAEVTDEKTTSPEGMYCSDVTAKNPDGDNLRVRTYVGRQRAYQIGVAADSAHASSPDLDRFLASFKVLWK